jgi:hypothetical protein
LTNLKFRESVTVRISQRLRGRKSESIPQSNSGHCEIQIGPPRVKAGPMPEIGSLIEFRTPSWNRLGAGDLSQRAVPARAGTISGG